MESARRLHREEGITQAISNGAAVTAALRVAAWEENRGQLMVTVLPDAGERSLSSLLFEHITGEENLKSESPYESGFGANPTFSPGAHNVPKPTLIS